MLSSIFATPITPFVTFWMPRRLSPRARRLLTSTPIPPPPLLSSATNDSVFVIESRLSVQSWSRKQLTSRPVFAFPEFIRVGVAGVNVWLTRCSTSSSASGSDSLRASAVTLRRSS